MSVSYDPEHHIVPTEPRKRGRPPESCTEHGARKRAEQLTEWWHSRGHTTVQFWIERARWGPGGRQSRRGSIPTVAPPLDFDDDDGPPELKKSGLWVIRSNLVNGLPPKNGH